MRNLPSILVYRLASRLGNFSQSAAYHILAIHLPYASRSDGFTVIVDPSAE